MRARKPGHSTSSDATGLLGIDSHGQRTPSFVWVFSFDMGISQSNTSGYPMPTMRCG
ncbi:protein of unknown function [Nitrospira japonica]|uniref:Uncharacterized protein n=1 Tax=Nitrospira japonica TaxID=1325564 RepID=A0A1W1IA17_9BACT|nr:protein of unknown function [Nitrospira japonica]